MSKATSKSDPQNSLCSSDSNEITGQSFCQASATLTGPQSDFTMPPFSRPVPGGNVAGHLLSLPPFVWHGESRPKAYGSYAELGYTV